MNVGIVLEVISGVAVFSTGIYAGIRSSKATSAVDRLQFGVGCAMLVLLGLYVLYMAGNGYILVRGTGPVHISP